MVRMENWRDYNHIDFQYENTLKKMLKVRLKDGTIVADHLYKNYNKIREAILFGHEQYIFKNQVSENLKISEELKEIFNKNLFQTKVEYVLPDFSLFKTKKSKEFVMDVIGDYMAGGHTMNDYDMLDKIIQKLLEENRTNAV